MRPSSECPRPELTPRALGTGVALGLLLTVANVYMGLATGWWETGTVTASILGLAVLSAFRRRRSTELEANTVQAVATAMGAVPSAAGLLGAVPALALLGRAPPAWAVAALGLALGALGVVLALALRRRLLEDEALPFPSGLAAAEVIVAGRAGRAGSAGGAVLGAAASASAAVTWLRDGAPRLLPGLLAAPGSIGGVPAAALGLGLSVSPLLLGAGALVGVANGLSVALGAAVGWAAIAPALVRSGAVPDAGYAALASWLLWPGAAIMLGGALASLASDLRAFRDGLGDLAAIRQGGDGSGRRAAAALLAASAATVVVVAAAGFGLPPAGALLALAAAALLTVACARAAGRTDIAPAGEVGQLAQATAGALEPGRGAAGLAAGAVVAGVAAQASVSLWSLQVGRKLGAAPARQARAQLLGVALGSAVAVPVYALLAGARGLGTAALPAPSAARWRALAELANRGTSALPPGAAVAAAIGLALGVALELGSRGRARRFLPSAGAVGLGFVIPAHYAAGIALGAVLGAAAERRWPGGGRVQGAAAGAIAGESLTALAVAALVAAGVLAAG
jgi:uncharacterized oligopeptide transporter (OPT) family protein